MHFMPNTSAQGEAAVSGEVKSEASRRLDQLKSNPLVLALSMLVAAITPTVLTWTSAATNREQTRVVKDQAEAGFQVSKNFLQEQREFNDGVREQLEAHARILAALTRAQAKPPAKRKESARAIAAVALPPAPPPSPSAPIAATLDKALEQVKAATPAP